MNDKEKSQAQQKVLDDPEFSRSLLTRSLSYYEQVVRDVFNARRDIFVFEILKKLRAQGLSSVKLTEAQGEQGTWIDVESLSRLRNVVGGRFENIKKKWVGAGFPLREHRGDKVKDFEVNTEGWVDLANWMSKHGFESRLRPDRPECLFQIRALAKAR